MVTGHSSNTFGGEDLALDRPTRGAFRTGVDYALRSVEPCGIRSRFTPQTVLYFRYGTSAWNLCKALERRGFSRIAQTRN
jgi:hypothetical protein